MTKQTKKQTETALVLSVRPVAIRRGGFADRSSSWYVAEWIARGTGTVFYKSKRCSSVAGTHALARKWFARARAAGSPIAESCYACDAPANGMRDLRPEGGEMEPACKRHSEPAVEVMTLNTSGDVVQIVSIAKREPLTVCSSEHAGIALPSRPAHLTADGLTTLCSFKVHRLHPELSAAQLVREPAGVRCVSCSAFATTSKRAAAHDDSDAAQLADIRNRNRNGIKAAPQLGSDPREELRITIARLCAGDCGATINYQLETVGAHYMPELFVVGGLRAFSGGHLCSACDTRITNALFSKEQS